MLYIRMLLLLISFCGYILLLNEKWNIPVEFSPAIICSSIVSILFCAGILNCFELVTFLVWLGGIFFFARLIIKFRANQARMRNGIIILIWLALLGYFAIFLRGSHFIRYDNFSHWATVIKNMLLTNRMPNFQDELIMFQAYPLGGPLFIYYICKVIGSSDACYLFGQIMLTLNFLLPLVVYIRKKNLLTLIVLPFAVYSLIVNDSIYDLLVDSVMPLAGVALFCMIAYQEKYTDKIFWCTMPVCIFLVNVKNSGIFFLLVCWCYFLIRYRKQWSRAAFTKFLLLDVAAPLGSIFLWKRHLSMVFVSGDTSKHAMSIANFQNVFAEKTSDDILKIGRLMISRIFTLDSVITKTLLILIAIMIFSVLRSIVLKANPIYKVKETIGVVCIFALYNISLYAMYIFSMPLSEAIFLAGFDRYCNSVLIFLFGIIVVFVLKGWDSPNWKWSVVVFLLMAFAVYLCKGQLQTLFVKQNYESSDRYKFQSLIRDNGVEAGKSYFIYQSSPDSGYLYFLGRYELWSNRIAVCVGGELEQKKEYIQSYDYLIIWNEDELITNYLKEVGLNQNASEGAVVVRVRHP